MEWIKHETGAKLTHIPYKGASDAMLAFKSNDIQLLYLIVGNPDIARQINEGEVKGLLVQNFHSGAAIGLYSSNNVITGSSLTSSTFGVEIANAVSGNIIGGATVRGRNVISGNNTGVSIHEQSTGNLVQGNCFGTDAGGAASGAAKYVC